MKNELFFLAKMAVALTVVDAFIPRAETLAKSKMDRHHNHSTQEQQSTSHPKHQEIRYRPTQPPTEMHMGLFDLNIFHGSGSGGSKEALDEQWETQQEILRARRGEKGHNVKKRKIESPKVEIKSAKTGAKVNVDVEEVAHHHKSNTPTFFWDLGK